MKERRNEQGLTEEEFLSRYSPGDYPRPAVTVDIIVFAINETLDALKILMIKRRNHPYIQDWALPGGFVEMEESLEEAALRELQEETGLRDLYIEQLYTYGKPNRDPRGRTISVAYMALVRENTLDPVAGDDAERAQWFTIKQSRGTVKLTAEDGEELTYYLHQTPMFVGGVESLVESTYRDENSGIAFDHDEIIQAGLSRLKNKAEYTNVLFGLMPPQFTLPELQRLYETVLGKTLYKANFRKRVKEFVEPIGEKKIQEGSRRSPELYRFKGTHEEG